MHRFYRCQSDIGLDTHGFFLGAGPQSAVPGTWLGLGVFLDISGSWQASSGIHRMGGDTYIQSLE